MMEMISNCRNNNGIAVYLQSNPGETKKIIKTSYMGKGIADLVREYSGWKWYQRSNLCGDLQTSCVVSARGDSFVRIEIDFIEGTKYDYRRPVRSNLSVLRTCVDWYIENWPYDKDCRGPIHGDFSLGNILERDGRIIVIDWEHFAANRAPWGVDIVYMLMEVIFFNKARWFGVRRRDVRLLKDLFGPLMATGQLNQDFMDQPLTALLAFMHRESDIWGEQLSKFPVLYFSEQDIKVVDDILGMGQ